MTMPVVFNGVTYQLQDQGGTINWEQDNLKYFQALALAVPGASITFAAVGSAPSANGATVAAGQVVTLQPADDTHPGVMTALAQSMTGVKNFTSGLSAGATGSKFDVNGTTGAVIAAGSVSGSGIRVATSVTRPAAAVGIRGMLWVSQGDSGAADVLSVCIKDDTDTYVWKVITLS